VRNFTHGILEHQPRSDNLGTLTVVSLKCHIPCFCEAFLHAFEKSAKNFWRPLKITSQLIYSVTPSTYQATTTVPFPARSSVIIYQDRPIERAAGKRRRHICPLKEPIICSNLFGERNVSFEKRTHARTAQRPDCPGLVLQMAFSLIDESPEKRSAENIPQLLKAAFENTALIKNTALYILLLRNTALIGQCLKHCPKTLP
jgi:hypothetical protein